MNKDIKKLWIAALRSGEYKQGMGKLRRAGRFCCLGVLCNLHAQAHPEIAATQKTKRRYLREEEFLPHEVREWAGLDFRNPEVKQPRTGELTSLADLNDDGYSFDQLANIIQRQL